MGTWPQFYYIALIGLTLVAVGNEANKSGFKGLKNAPNRCKVLPTFWWLWYADEDAMHFCNQSMTPFIHWNFDAKRGPDQPKFVSRWFNGTAYQRQGFMGRVPQLGLRQRGIEGNSNRNRNVTNVKRMVKAKY